MNLLIMGLPGAGKRTQAAKIVENLMLLTFQLAICFA